MLQCFLLLLIGVSLYASEEKSIKKEETKFVLKEGENTFTITKGYFPYIDAMMAFPSEKILGTAEKPKPLSDLNLDIVDQTTLTTMQQLVARINETDPTFLTKSSDWFLYERYKSPPQWDAVTQELLPLSTTSVKNLLDLAHASDFLNSESLTLLLLDVLANRLISGTLKGEAIALQSSSVDLMFAQIIINKALIEGGSEVTVVSAPMNDEGDDAIVVNKNSLFLCPTAVKKGCCFVINKPNNNFQNHILVEQQMLTEKWLSSYSYPFGGAVLATDASFDLKYQLLLIRPDNDPHKFTFLVVDNVANRYSTLVNAVEHIVRNGKASDVSFIFEDNSYDFYIKINDDVYKSNAKTVFDTNGKKALFLQQVTMSNIDDLFIRKYLNKQNSVCRCLEQKRKEIFNTRVLHTYTYSSYFMDYLKKIYGVDFNIVQTACNHDAFNHVLLLQNAQDAGRHSIARVSFAPDKRIQHLLDCMNKLPTDTGTLYANALCACYIYTSKWGISAQNLENKMGALYNVIDPSMKTIIQNTLPSSLIARSSFYAKKAGSFLKQSISFLRLPATAAAAVGAIGVGAFYPFATLLTIPLAGSLAYRWKRNYQQKHRLTDTEIKTWLLNSAMAMAMISMFYIGEHRGSIGFGELR